MAEQYPDEHSDWVYDSFEDGVRSQHFRGEAMGDELLSRRKAESEEALDMLYDVATMDEEQLQTLVILYEADVLSSDEVSAIRRSIEKADTEIFDDMSERYGIDSYIEQHKDRVPLFARFVTQMSSGIDLTDTQISAARAQMDFEQQHRNNVA